MTRQQKDVANRPPASGAQLNKPESRGIFLLDDHPIMLTGLRELIESEPGLAVCGTARDAESALGEISRLNPDLVITDLTLPGKSGLELVKDLHVMMPSLPILVLSMHDELLHGERVLKAGARGYLMKESSNEKLLEAISKVLSGAVYVSERMNAQIVQAYTGHQPRGSVSPIKKLSDREFEVFQLMGHGRTTAEIAAQLHLSGKTVAVHRGHIKEKLDIQSAAELVRFAVRWLESQSRG